ncbi:YciI family protein [Nonomuraea sp. NPDC002799]
MRYLMMSKSSSTPPGDRLYADMGTFIEELTEAGVLVATGGLEAGGILVTSSGDKVTVTDGPFAGAMAAVTGFALVEVASREEAIDLTRRFRKIVGDGESVIQRVF